MTRQALVIESDPSLNRLLRRIMSKLGWAVMSAQAFDQALDAYETGRYDLVLCELDLEGDGGLMLARALRRSEPSLGIIMTCGNGARSAQAQSDGFGHLLMKPFKLEDLCRLVDAISAPRALDARRYSR